MAGQASCSIPDRAIEPVGDDDSPRARVVPRNAPTSTSASRDGTLRACRIVTFAATAWYALALTWGFFARVGGGHDAQIATRSIVAENMQEWHIVAPVKDYTLAAPTPDLFYVHHPWGMFWLIATFARVLGRGTWVPRLVAMLLSLACPPLLYGIGRALWGPVPGAICALAYVVLPITLAFGNLPGFEVPVIFACLLTTWGYLRFTERWERRWMLVSLAGVFAAANSDWQAMVFLGAVLVLLGAGVLALPRPFGGARTRPFALWWVLAATLTGATLAAYVAYFRWIGAIDELLRSEAQRSKGNDVPLATLLRGRSYWIDVTFTPLAVAVGKVAAPVFLARAAFGRRIGEAFPLALLAMAAVQYVAFSNGADMHIYWPMPFAPYWALSLGVLAATAIQVGQRAAAVARRPHAAALVPAAALAVFGAIALRVLPDGVQGLRYAKATAGRFNEKGHRIFEDVDTAQAMEWMGERMQDTRTVVAMDKELASREYHGLEWALRRPVASVVSSLYFAGANAPNRYYVGDLRFLTGDDQRRAAAAHHLVTVGPYLFIDRSAASAPLEAFRFDEREPTWLEWYLWSPTEPVRAVHPDPWATWELRAHYEQAPNPEPGDPPATLEQIRIAHNAAVARGDASASDRFGASLLSAIDTSVAADFRDGTRLLGLRCARGVAPTLELYFLATGPLAGDYLFEVASRVEAAPPLSLVPADERLKKYGVPFTVSPMVWRKGFIYADRVPVPRRPGRERFAGFFDIQATTSGIAPDPPAPATGDRTEVALVTMTSSM